jgi:hypothetical protein
MKFFVRKGYAVHHDYVVEIEADGRKLKEERRDSYYSGDKVEFNAEQAANHVHKLEPAPGDKEAAAFLAQYHFKPKPEISIPAA